MNALRMVIPTLLAGTFACASAGTSPLAALPRTNASAVTKTTSAEGASSDESGCARADRTSEAELAEARANRAADAATRREHDALEIRVLEAMENADLALAALRDRAQEDSFKDWLAVDKALRNAQRYKSKLMVDLRRLHGDLGMMSWPVFKRGVEVTLEELEAVASQARATK